MCSLQAAKLCDYNTPALSGLLPASWLTYNVDKAVQLQQEVARSRAHDAQVHDHTRQLLRELCAAMTRVPPYPRPKQNRVASWCLKRALLLNGNGQSRVTLSLLSLHLRAALLATAGRKEG